MKKIACGLLLLAPALAGAQGSALPGPTGLLTVPTADVIEEGTIAFGASRHDTRPVDDGLTNYLFGIGFMPGLELGGRIAQRRSFGGPSNDLSLNAKYRIWTFDFGPQLAIGATDIGGEAPKFRSRYALVTWPWRSLGVTAGHRWGKDLAEGTIGGVEWRPWRMLGIYAEYDTEEVNPGLRLQSPRLWGGLTVRANAGYREATDEVEGGIEFSVPLGNAPGARRSRPAPAAPPPAAGMQPLRRALEDLGFESVRTGTRPDGTLVVSLENRRYNHSSADGVGLALGTIATRAAPEVERIELNLSAYGVPQIAAATSVQGWRDFLSDGIAAPDLLEVRNIDGADAGIAWQNSPAALGALELYVEPVLRTFVATEYGVLDAGAGVRTRLVAPLAGGVTAQLGLQAPVALSEDFRDGRNFADFAPEAGLDLLVLQYADKLTPGWTSLWSAGLMQVVQTDLSVFGTEQAWISPQGRHRVNAKLMSMASGEVHHDILLGGYTWYDAARRYSAGITGGQFYFEDTGVRLEVNRHFDDAFAGLFLKVEAEDNMAGGFQLSVPLTPRRDAMPRGIQVKGLRRWGHSLQTTLHLPDNTNALKPLLLYEPTLDLDLRRDLLDSGRLGPAYLRSELPRMREAWELWGE